MMKLGLLQSSIGTGHGQTHGDDKFLLFSWETNLVTNGQLYIYQISNMEISFQWKMGESS